MGDDAKKGSEGAKSESSSQDSKLDTLIAAITSMRQQMDNLEQKSQSQEDWRTKLEARLAGENLSDDKSEGDKGTSEDARKEVETQPVETNNVSDNGNNRVNDDDSHNDNNDQPQYALITQGSATVGTKELNIKVGLGTKKEVKEFKSAQEHLTKFRKTIDIRYQRYRKQIEETDDADELKALKE